ncbi:zinc ribbon domain-containing protein [uncultured Alistipes sp.]|uniref:zinc ribbon domain-containing protein n=1 Tax=uncultured Alistipes sp. TaxID=538949 RepID=UPI00262537DB|nr:zinc ribbon domain-containing protein [uncultured Alistipes sp.]
MKTEQDERQGQSPVCQSCAMPLTEEKLYGTNADGSPNRDYCVYCYRNGDFAQSCTMDGMIEHCAGMLAQVNAASGMNITREEYVAYMREVFPKLKRWRQASDR